MYNFFADRKEIFPMLKNHPEFVYFDNASTALTPQSVVDEIVNYYQFHNTNTSRGVDKMLYETSEKFEQIRKKVQQYIGAEKKEEVIFTRGTTAALNLVAFGLGGQILQKDDEIILNIAEHHANIIPWQEIAHNKGAKIIYVDLNEDGSINLFDLEKKLTNRTKIVSFAQVTNVLSSYNNPKEITKLVKEKSAAYVIVDGAQGIVQHSVDVQDIGCDFYAFSGHKLYGPTGVGVLYGKASVLALMHPFEFGGDMNDSVYHDYSTYKDAPQKFETGTMMIAEVFGLGAAIDFVEKIDQEKKIKHLIDLRAYTIQQMKQTKDIIIYNEALVDAPTICFNIKNVHAHDVASVFSNHHISLRAGHHCAQLLLEKLKTSSSLRMTIGIHNNKEDVDSFITALQKAGDFLDVLF